MADSYFARQEPDERELYAYLRRKYAYGKGEDDKAYKKAETGDFIADMIMALAPAIQAKVTDGAVPYKGPGPGQLPRMTDRVREKRAMKDEGFEREAKVTRDEQTARHNSEYRQYLMEQERRRGSMPMPQPKTPPQAPKGKEEPNYEKLFTYPGATMEDFTIQKLMGEGGFSQGTAEKIYLKAVEFFNKESPVEKYDDLDQGDWESKGGKLDSDVPPVNRDELGMHLQSKYGSGPMGMGKSMLQEAFAALPGHNGGESAPPVKAGKGAPKPPAPPKPQPKGWASPAEPLPGNPLPDEPPKGAAEMGEKLTFARQMATALQEAAGVVSSVGPEVDIPGAGMGPHLINTAPKLGAGVGAVGGGAIGALSSGGLGTLAGVGAGAAAGTAIGTLGGAAGQKFISGEGLKLQRSLTNLASALIYFRSGKQINETEAQRILKAEGIDFADPNADRNLRQGIPVFLKRFREDLKTLDATDPQAAEYLRRQGVETAKELQATLDQIEAKMQNPGQYTGSTGVDSRDVIEVTGPDGQRWRVHRGSENRGASGRW